MKSAEVMRVLGISPKTLSRWRVKIKRGDPGAPLLRIVRKGGHYEYNDEDVYSLSGQRRPRVGGKKRVVLYARSCYGRRPRLDVDIERQKEKIRVEVERTGDTISVEYVEYSRGISYDKVHRPALYRLMKDIRGGIIGRVYVCGLDRFGLYGVGEMLIEMMKLYGVDVVDVSGGVLHSSYRYEYYKELQYLFDEARVRFEDNVWKIKPVKGEKIWSGVKDISDVKVEDIDLLG